jgi:hypothetical protein
MTRINLLVGMFSWFPIHEDLHDWGCFQIKNNYIMIHCMEEPSHLLYNQKPIKIEGVYDEG